MDNRFQTETAAMRTLTFASPRGDISFRIGLGLVAALAVAELFAAGYYYASLHRGHRASVAVATTTTATNPPEPLPTATPASEEAVPAPSVAPTVAALPSAPPIPADERLVKEAIDLSNRGDTATALSRLQQARDKNPRNAQAYAEMAKIYEATNKLDLSNEMWRRVYELGPSSGAVFELADARLKRGVTATPPPATITEATPEQAPPTPAPVPAAEGVPEGSTFGISEVTTSEMPDPDADMNLLLKIGVKKRPTVVIDHTKVKIQVFFYDTVDDRDIKLTDAEVNYEWLTPDHDWATARPEVLAVTYVRPKNKAKTQDAALTEAAAAMNPGKKGRTAKATPPPAEEETGRRKYLGYIVRIYYNDKLQAVRADPTKLLNLFPPPSTATPP